MGGIDVEIGRRLRALRWTQGLSMEQVAARIGIAYQQIQRYEAGSTRLSANRLFELARLFDVPVGAFFEDLDLAADEPGRDGPILDARGFRLAYEFSKLTEPQKRAVLSLVRSMSEEPATSGQRNGS